jgi:Fic family protein
MVTIRKRPREGQTYYYLEHSIRINGKVVKKELYLGKRIPKNIEELKKNFLGDIYRQRWQPIFDSIKKGFSKEIRRMPRTAREKETESFMVRFTYDTQRIEGSTLTLRETADLLERGITPREKRLADVKETEGHRKAFYDMLAHKKGLSLKKLLQWHGQLFQETKTDIAGRIRQHQVAITGSRFEPPFPAEIHPLIREFFRWYARSKGRVHPVELAALAHLKFVTIHPFADGNGRISRLIMNFVLNRHGYPMFNIPYGGRSSYYTALERAQTKEMESIFLQWFAKRYVKAQERYLKE